jgi:hypothetical protein
MVTGLVARTDPKNHGAVTVYYSDGLRQYEKAFSPYRMRVGEPVVVYYDPHEPETAAIELPTRLLRDDAALSAVAGVFFGTLATFVARHPRVFRSLNLGRIWWPKTP